MFLGVLSLIGGIFTVIFIILFVPDIPITFNDLFHFCMYTFILFLFPISIFAMLAPGTMSSVYNKIKSIVTRTEQPLTMKADNTYGSFNLVTVTIGFMSIIAFVCLFTMFIYDVKIKHEYYDDSDKKNGGNNKGRLCETEAFTNNHQNDKKLHPFIVHH